jgi:hypothetical protein
MDMDFDRYVSAVSSVAILHETPLVPLLKFLLKRQEIGNRTESDHFGHRRFRSGRGNKRGSRASHHQKIPLCRSEKAVSHAIGVGIDAIVSFVPP